MKKLCRWICCVFILIPLLSQTACSDGAPKASDFELTGSQWRLTYEHPKFGHRESDLIFLEAGKLIYSIEVGSPDNDEWQVNDKSVVLIINGLKTRFDYKYTYTGEFLDPDHMSGTAVDEKGVSWSWKAYRQKMQCFKAEAEQSLLGLEVCVQATEEQSAVDPYLSPWKSKTRKVYYAAGSSSSSGYGGHWLKEHKGKLAKAILRVKNNTADNQKMPVPILEDVVIRSKGWEGHALALCYPNNQVVLKMKGKAMELDIFPNETVALLYYIPVFKGKATLGAKGLGISKVVLD